MKKIIHRLIICTSTTPMLVHFGHKLNNHAFFKYIKVFPNFVAELLNENYIKLLIQLQQAL